MSTPHDMQAQRYELKFMVPESLRTAVRAYVSSYLELDSFARDDYSYAIHSIYLDSPNLHTYFASVNGDRNRHKLRIRYYDDSPTAPVFLETKRKVCDVVQKQRCVLPRAAVHDALAGDVSRVRPSEISGHQAFCSLVHQTNATPRAHVAYFREAWVSPHDNSVRVTMDRNVQVSPCFDLSLGMQLKKPVTVFPGEIVLELKFTTRYPDWFRSLVQTFNLMQCGAAKYAGGIELHGEHRFRQMPELQYV